MDQSYEAELNSLESEKATIDHEKVNCEKENSDQVNIVDIKEHRDSEKEPSEQMKRDIKYYNDEMTGSEDRIRMSESNDQLIDNDDFDRSKTLPSIVKIKVKSDTEYVNEQPTNDTSVKIVNLTPKCERKPFVQKPEILFSLDDVVNKVNQNYKNSNYLKLNNSFAHFKQVDPTSKSNLEPNAHLKGSSIDIAFMKSTDSKKLNVDTLSSRDIRSSIDESLVGSNENSVKSVKELSTVSTSSDTSKEEMDNTEEKIPLNKKYTSVIDLNINNEDQTKESTKNEIQDQEVNLIENDTLTILPPPNEFANIHEEVWIDSNSIQNPSLENATMEILLYDLEAEAINDLHANVINTFTNPLAQVTYYTHAQEFNEYLSTMLSEDSVDELRDMVESGSIVDNSTRSSKEYAKASKENAKSREAFRERDLSSLSSDQDVDFGSDNFITQDELDLFDSSEVSSVTEFTLNDIRMPSSPTQWKFVKPEHTDSIEVNLSDHSDNSGYDSSEESGAKSDEGDEAESPPLKPDGISDDEVSNFLFRLSSDLETFWNCDKKDVETILDG